MWAISNLTGGNRVSRAILLRYSAVPLAESESAPQTPASVQRGRSIPGHAVSRHAAASIQLPLDVEETVTCFCR